MRLLVSMDIGMSSTGMINRSFQHLLVVSNIMTLEEACQFIGKKQSTMYSLTSERRIPFRKRGNKLYFFKKELIEWIQSGGAYDKPYTLTETEQAEFDAHLQQMREKKRHKPSSIVEPKKD